jgi:aspartate/methionine/tyrosine aminotransferase
MTTVDIQPARRLIDIPFSGIRRIFGRAVELEREGKHVIHLEIGRPDFDTPEHIKQAAKTALNNGQVHYTPNDGIPALRTAISKDLHLRYGLTYEPQGEIIVTVGAAEAIYLAYLSFLDPGDDVLVPEPAWMNYFHCARLVDAVPVTIPLRQENGFQLDPDDLTKRLTPRSKMLVLNSPQNPTGAIYTKETLQAIAAIADNNNLLVVSDEIYSRLIYDGLEHISFASLPGMFQRTITVNGFSKTYSMTGWRLGYTAAPRNLSEVMIKAHQYSVTSTTSFAQFGALAAYTGDQADAELMALEFDRRRRLLIDELALIPNITFARPQGGFYIFPSIRKLGINGEAFCTHLIDNYQVAMVPGSVFGQSGEYFVRIAYSTSYEDLQEAAKRIKYACHELGQASGI